jgi:hypothetical protein
MASQDIYVVVCHRVVAFLQVLETSPCRGGATEILSSHYYVSFFSGEDPLKEIQSTPIVFLVAVGPPAPHRLATAPTRYGPASLTLPPPLV